MRTEDKFARDLVERALVKGASQSEVYFRRSRSMTVDARNGGLEALERARGSGYCLRLIKDGRLGFSFSNDFTAADTVLETALATSGLTGADEFLDFPNPSEPASLEFYDSRIDSISEREALDCAVAVERAARDSDRRISNTRKASASFVSAETLIVNSKGVFYYYPSTLCTAHVMSVAEERGENQMGWFMQAGRFLSDVDFAAVGLESGRRATLMLGARNVRPSKLSVVLDSIVAAEFLSVFASMLSSESVQKHKSLLAGKIGERVVSNLIGITDDGLMPHGPGSRAIDDEGVPVRLTELIKEGVLRNYMYSTHTARKVNTQSTGNALRGGISTPPSVGPINLFLTAEGETHEPSELVGTMERGLFVTEAMGIHTVNPVSGDFSVGVAGLWIEDGKAKFPIKEAVLSGNLLVFFGRVEAVGSDLRFYGNIGSPSVRMGETDVSA